MKYQAQITYNSKNIILWGEQNNYLKTMLKKIGKKISFTGVFKDEGFSADRENGWKKFSVEDLKSIENPVIIIADENIECIKRKVRYLREANLQYDHISNYGNEISIQILDALNYNDYTDYLENHICFDKEIRGNGKILIKKCNDSAAGNIIELGKVLVVESLSIYLFGKSSSIKMGDSSCQQVSLLINTNGSISIGDDCMLSRGIHIAQPDQHLIFDLHTKERININKNIDIGNHVWIGRTVQILGGCFIADNCVVGACSVTSGKFYERNCIIAGSPATVIRRDIIWARDDQTNDFQTYFECSDKAALKYLNDDE